MAIKRADFPLPDLADALVGEFFAAAARSELCIPRCGLCDRWCWYPEPVCPVCSGKLAWTATSGRGRLFSWAMVRRAFIPAFADLVPFVTALVALEEDPAVRVVAFIVDVDPEALCAEMPVSVTFRPLRFPTVPDREVIVPMFTPSAS